MQTTQTKGFMSHEACRASGPERVARLSGWSAQTLKWKVRNLYRPSNKIRVSDQTAWLLCGKEVSTNEKRLSNSVLD
jgi:hypothetical protein